MVDILAFGTHPDDVELHMGGTLFSLRKKGYTTAIVDLTHGELSTKGNLEIREKETNIASKILELNYRENLDLGDGIFLENLENRDKIVKTIRKYRPKIIFAPNSKDRHPDHERASRLIREANFYSGLKKYKNEENNHYRAEKIFYYFGNYEIEPTFVYDTSEFINIKTKLIEAYNSQFFSKNKESTFVSRPEYIEFIISKMRFYGERAGIKYAEPFFFEGLVKMSFDDELQ
jgi:bacillithiol biosynthesis deacetylase BshB1